MEVLRKLPENFDDNHLCYFEPNLKINIPEPGWKRISKKMLLLSNGIVINGLHVEKESLLYNSRLKDIGGITTLLKLIAKSVAMGQISRAKDDGPSVTIVNEWSNNFFHWFTEALPKLYCFLQNEAKPTILLPANHAFSFQKRSLEMLGFRYKYFYGKGLVCNNVYLPFRLSPSSAQYNPEVLKQLVLQLKAGTSLEMQKGERIYVTRAKANKRKIINEQDVLDKVKSFGFDVIDFEDYNLDEQISIMHNAKILVSMHGAGLTNLIFCKSGSGVLELSLKNQVMDKCYFNLANAMDLIYYYQFCESDNNLNDYHNADILVDTNKLEINLDKMISKIYD